jgi:hypothetical protein
MNKENRLQTEYLAQFEYLKTVITTRLFGNINYLAIVEKDNIIPADLKYNDNMSKDGNMERVRFAIMNEIADSPFDNNPIILDKLIEYFFGSEEFEGALEKFGWDIF